MFPKGNGPAASIYNMTLELAFRLAVDSATVPSYPAYLTRTVPLHPFTSPHNTFGL